jgi:hypothetical protein
MLKTLKPKKQSAIDHHESWLENEAATIGQKDKWYDGSCFVWRSGRGAIATVAATGNSSEVAQNLSAILLSDSEAEASRAGRQAHMWLDGLPESSRSGFLRGFASVVRVGSQKFLQKPTVYVVSMELLARFAPPLAAPIVMGSLSQRPLVSEHVFLLGLASFLRSKNPELKELQSATGVVSELLSDSLVLDHQVEWRPDLIVECVRILSKVAPAELVEQLCPRLAEIGEIEMTAVLGELVSAASVVADRTLLANQVPFLDSIWDTYVNNQERMNAEGILARLAQLYLIAGHPTHAVIDRVCELPIGTDVLYLAAIENLPIREEGDREMVFRVAATRLLEESQGLALSRLLAFAQKQGMNVAKILSP